MLSICCTANATGIGWEAAFQQASAFVAQLTLKEKSELVTGETGPCVGNIPAIPRLGFHGLCSQDGPLAIRQADYASAFPAGLTVAATWDRDLAHKRGYEMGMEFKDKGANIILGPVAGPLGRSGYGGRNWEGFSPDPYLTGMLFEEVSTKIGMYTKDVHLLTQFRLSLASKRPAFKLVPNVSLDHISWIPVIVLT
jgi:beta-glucosidase